MRSPMSLRRTAYVVPNLNPPRGLITQNGPFQTKSALLSTKVCYKVSLCEKRQRQRCKAFIGLSIRVKMVDEDVPYYVKIWQKLTHPLQKRRFPISIRS